MRERLWWSSAAHSSGTTTVGCCAAELGQAPGPQGSSWQAGSAAEWHPAAPHCPLGSASAAFGSGLLLPWSHGHGQQQDVAFSLLRSFGFHIVHLCSCMLLHLYISCISMTVLLSVHGDLFL